VPAGKQFLKGTETGSERGNKDVGDAKERTGANAAKTTVERRMIL